MKPKDAESLFRELLGIMKRLRGEGGCPWDRAQNMDSLRKYVLEEAYEVVSAINQKRSEYIREELGDLLLQVVFLSRIAEEEGLFDICDVIEGINHKLVKRHPHVFGSERIHTPEGVLQRWRELKGKEKDLHESPEGLPAMLQAVKAGEWAEGFGYDWKTPQDVVNKIKEELGEVEEICRGSPSESVVEDEIGDLLFSVVNLSRKLKIDPEVALFKAVERFRRRVVMAVEAIRAEGLKPERLDEENLDKFWRQAKEKERKSSPEE